MDLVLVLAGRQAVPTWNVGPRGNEDRRRNFLVAEKGGPGDVHD
ncbi:MAG: hypothetical protein AB7I19_03850 [Planctomycetota bacterium]